MGKKVNKPMKLFFTTLNLIKLYFNMYYMKWSFLYTRDSFVKLSLFIL